MGPLTNLFDNSDLKHSHIGLESLYMNLFVISGMILDLIQRNLTGTSGSESSHMGLESVDQIPQNLFGLPSSDYPHRQSLDRMQQNFCGYFGLENYHMGFYSLDRIPGNLFGVLGPE